MESAVAVQMKGAERAAFSMKNASAEELDALGAMGLQAKQEGHRPELC
jgi:hypothetical protein